MLAQQLMEQQQKMLNANALGPGNAATEQSAPTVQAVQPNLQPAPATAAAVLGQAQHK